ncbi:MAG: integral rane protein TerC [Chitinophagaceae bacterium]|nr:integral rane protein TerC [Chitinophagaceae bacterium]
MQNLFSTEGLISFLVLVVLEIVLGVDNVIFVSIIMNRMAKHQQKKARTYWMIFGIIIRSILLFGLTWLLSQKGKPVFTLFGKGFDLASLVMIAGGLILIYKTVKEIHHKLEGEEETHQLGSSKPLNFRNGIIEIVVIDMVFSFDSIITAGGTAQHVEVMIAAVIAAMIIMFIFSPAIAKFIHKHPTIKMLALSFLVMIGLVLLIEGYDGDRAHEMHLKNYVYFAMAFSFGVEILNLRMRKKAVKPVELREPYIREERQNDDDAAH